jgi:hypothetical protein
MVAVIYVAVGVLTLLLVLFIALYRKSLKESRDVINFALASPSPC